MTPDTQVPNPSLFFFLVQYLKNSTPTKYNAQGTPTHDEKMLPKKH
jgi:hypothetical protein